MIPASLNTKEKNPLDVLKFYAIEKESISYSAGNDLIMDIMWRLAVMSGPESERIIRKLKGILFLNDKKKHSNTIKTNQ